MTQRWNVAVLGATGLVGETLLTVLEERNFPVQELFPLASDRSLGKTVQFKGRALPVLDAAKFDFSRAQLGLFSAGGEVSALYAPKAAAAGCVVIDNTSQFRYQADIPLVVPEVNPAAIAQYTHRGIIANPNCSTIQMVVALKPIHDAVGIERINVATYQSVSGAGRKGGRRTRRADRRSCSTAGRSMPKVHAEADRIQLCAADRQVHGQRLHQRRDEDALGDAENLRRRAHPGKRHGGARAGLLSGIPRRCTSRPGKRISAQEARALLCARPRSRRCWTSTNRGLSDRSYRSSEPRHGLCRAHSRGYDP